MQGIDYKQKYKALKSRFNEAIDFAFQTGYEKGYQEATQDAQAQQMADQQQQMAAMQQGMGGQVDENGQPIDPNQDDGGYFGEDQGQGADDAQAQQGQTELGSKLDELQGLISKSENIEELKAALAGLAPSIKKISEARQSTELRKAMTTHQKAKKAQKAVKKFSVGHQKNLSSNAKGALNMQEKIIGDIMKSWDTEEDAAKTDIEKVLGAEGHIK
jgi:hypothetical protein